MRKYVLDLLSAAMYSKALCALFSLVCVKNNNKNTNKILSYIRTNKQFHFLQNARKHSIKHHNLGIQTFFCNKKAVLSNYAPLQSPPPPPPSHPHRFPDFSLCGGDVWSLSLFFTRKLKVFRTLSRGDSLLLACLSGSVTRMSTSWGTELHPRSIPPPAPPPRLRGWLKVDSGPTPITPTRGMDG